MQQVVSNKEMIHLSQNWPQGKTIGFIPTMGYLHEGHLSLVAESNKQCDITVVSIFINPSQFGVTEDLSSYPRDMKRDLTLLQQYNVDYVFCPTSDEMYPKAYQTWVNVEEISSVLCGASRPGHFRGVATVVLKLVNLIKPELMFMGEKDFQQIAVLKTMLKDLNFETHLVSCPIVRETDGLAMSSRNKYLNPQERTQAKCLSQAIQKIRTLYKEGEQSVDELRNQAVKLISDMGGRIDYISFVNPETLQEVNQVLCNSRIVMAVFIGKTRLIDNSPMS